MNRKLFSLIACLVLVFSFVVVQTPVQAEEGGSISGTVYQDDGVTPISDVQVVACSDGDNEICYGADSDGSGNYTIAGLPLDTTEYRVYVWGQPGWSNEFWEETIWWHLATLVQAGATGIDFTLVPAGTISGTVIDADGNPIANMGVDIVDGGYGVCTDVDGYYSIKGLPFGTYDIDAGRDFCGPSSYVVQVIEAVTIDKDTPNVSGYNFTLELGGSISGTVTDEEGNPVSDDDNIDISACLFGDDSVCWWADVVDGIYLITGLPDGDYRVHAYQYPGGFWIDEFYKNTSIWEEAKPVKVELGKNKKNVDFSLELGGSISGYVTAEGGRLIEENIDVSACLFDNDSICGWATVQADGSYLITGLHAGTYRVSAYQYPGDTWVGEFFDDVKDWNWADPVEVTAGDETKEIYFELSTEYYNPTFLVNLTPNEVLSWGWIDGTKVSLAIYDDSGAQVYSPYPVIADSSVLENPWEPSVKFSFPAELGLGAGYRVTLSDGTTTKEHIVNTLSVFPADAKKDIVSGVADPGAEVFVDAWLGAMRRTTADKKGFWSVDFSVPGAEDWEQDIIDIGPGDGGGVNIYDKDGDSTNINWWAAPEE